MAIYKKRINISVSEDVDKAITVLAERDHVPVATKAFDLIQRALQIEEDDVLNAVAEKREAARGTYLSHDQAWS